jgi:hypothetical protein
MTILSRRSPTRKGFAMNWDRGKARAVDENLDDDVVLSREALPRSELGRSNAKTAAASTQHRVAEVEVERHDDEIVCEAVLDDITVIRRCQAGRRCADVAMSASVEIHGHIGDHVLIEKEAEA